MLHIIVLSASGFYPDITWRKRMRGNIITFANQKLDFHQFCEKVEKYDLELTRADVISILNETKEKNPSLVPAILNVIKNTYHINLAY